MFPNQVGYISPTGLGTVYGPQLSEGKIPKLTPLCPVHVQSKITIGFSTLFLPLYYIWMVVVSRKKIVTATVLAATCGHQKFVGP